MFLLLEPCSSGDEGSATRGSQPRAVTEGWDASLNPQNCSWRTEEGQISSLPINRF